VLLLPESHTFGICAPLLQLLQGDRNCLTVKLIAGAAMKHLEVGDRVKILDGGKDDEGTVLDVDEGTEMVIVYLGRHVGGRAFHRDDLRKVRAH